MKFEAGEAVIWVRRPKGGYGYTHNVPAIYREIKGNMALIDAELAAGGSKPVWVRAGQLRRASKALERPLPSQPEGT